MSKCAGEGGSLKDISSADTIRRVVEEYVMSGETVLLDFRGVISSPEALRMLMRGLSSWADTQPGSVMVAGMSHELIAQLKIALT